jgi:hypothetical protein
MSPFHHVTVSPAAAAGHIIMNKYEQEEQEEQEEHKESKETMKKRRREE